MLLPEQHSRAAAAAVSSSRPDLALILKNKHRDKDYYDNRKTTWIMSDTKQNDKQHWLFLLLW